MLVIALVGIIVSFTDSTPITQPQLPSRMFDPNLYEFAQEEFFR